MRNNRDYIKVAFIVFILSLFVAIFFFTPSIRPSSLITILNILLLSPLIKFAQKRGLSKSLSISVVFIIVGFFMLGAITYATQVLSQQWLTILRQLPSLGNQLILFLNQFEQNAEAMFGIKINIGATQWISGFGEKTQAWLIYHLPALLGDFASAFFLVPIFSFFILRDGQTMIKPITDLVPTQHKRITLVVVGKISKALSQYLRAKTLEALLVGTLIFVGLNIVGAPYAGVFGLVAGITNVIPYLGPILGAIPALALMGFSEGQTVWPTLFVFLIVNALDMIVIFPIFVAKLVNLSPFTLLVAVAVGQEFYGVIGMLISVPLASIFKIIFQELTVVLSRE